MFIHKVFIQPRTDYRCRKQVFSKKGNWLCWLMKLLLLQAKFCGALQDWDRATIIGRRTFGKGLVQQQYNLSDGAALRLTIARYYTPLGRNIQKPYDKGKEAYEEELINRFHDGEVVVGDTAKPTAKPFKTPDGRLVYGGGGITPDIFVPFDTSAQPRAVSEMFFKGTISNYIYHFFIQNKPSLDQIKTTTQLRDQYSENSFSWPQLAVFASRDSINLDSVSPSEKKNVLEKMPAYLARQIFRTEGYYEMVNSDDAMVKKALETLNSK